MKTAMLTGIRKIEIVETPDPEIVNNTDVLVKMGSIGVCGSGVHYYVDGKIGSQVIEFPFPVGHEGAGVVQEVGAAVTHVKPGDRVAVEPAMPCGECDQCKAGRSHTCRKLKFLGCPKQADGCLSEYVVMPEHSCFPIPDSMTLDQAALSEPLAIGVYAVKMSIPMKGTKVGILGAGPIGLSCLLPARWQGSAKVYMTDKLDERLELARTMGADWVGNVDKQDIVAEINSAEKDQLDVVFECCGQQDALNQALEILKPGGKLMIVGIPKNLRISFNIDKLRRKEICIQNVRRQNGCVQDTLDMISSQAVKADPMITHHFAFDQTKEAFDLVAGYKDGVVKAMIEFGIE
jgi:L-iditol 2-dehydrogenase